MTLQGWDRTAASPNGAHRSRATEHDLRASEALSRAIIESLHEGVIVHDFDDILMSNRSARRILGVDLDAELTPDLLRLDSLLNEHGDPLSAGDRAGALAAMRSGKAQLGMLGGVRRPDGEIRWCLFNSTPLFHDGEEAPYAAVISLSDITDRKNTDEELRESEARFRTLAEALPLGVYHTDARGRLLYVNPVWTHVTERSFEETSNIANFERVHPDDVETVESGVSELVRTRKLQSLQYRLVMPDGEIRWVSTRNAAISDGDVTTGYVGTVDNITPTIIAQEETARLAGIVESTSDMVGIIDFADGRFLYLNRAGRELFGYDNHTVEQPTLAEVFTDEAMRVVEAEVVPSLAAGSSWTGELDMRTREGQVLRVWQSMAGEIDNKGRLRAVSSVGRDVTERIRQADELAYQATHDPLTDLPNRTMLLEALDEAIDAARDRRRLVALLFLDLDRFKVVNDSLGHDAGDELLIEAARRISRVLRPGDIVARLGGDEFVVVCRDVTDAQQASAIALRITTALESTPIVLGNGELSITASVGVALSDGEAAHPESLLRDADAAMYRAKDLGRARLELFDESMRRHHSGRREVAEELADAIERGQIEVHFQPCVTLADMRVTSVEALARWNHPERGLLLPEEFISVAEETGQIVGLGLSVLRVACEQGHSWEAAMGAAAPRVHVNLSARQLSASNLPELVLGVLDGTGLSPSRLCLEITESVLMDDAASAVNTLWDLKALGVVLAIDDFGTGYSSLSYLRKFPVDVIKVDRSFVDGLGPDPEDSAVVAAIISLAHTLDLEAVAEGVETVGQVDALRNLGCHGAQGFLFAHPMPATDVTPVLGTAYGDPGLGSSR
jgi:diguanylate cyclase (GGDEF)-like protein/PAS domain S-box-containing protein